MQNHEDLIQELEAMKLPELQKRYAEIVGEESRCPNKSFLLKRIRQVLAEGEPSDAPTASKPVRGRFKSMTVEELQAMYLDRVGRVTGSNSRAYLVWKIREAEKGRIPIGPRGSRRDGSSNVRILPMRLEEHVVEKLDAVWRGQGMKSRMEFFRRAIGDYLEQIGETDVAALFR